MVEIVLGRMCIGYTRIGSKYDKVTFNPSTLLYGCTWTSKLFEKYKRKKIY